MAGETTQADATATQVAEQEDADFEAGFDHAGTGSTETPNPDAGTTEQAAKDAEDAALAASLRPSGPPAAPAATPAAPGPKKVEVDEAELQALRTRAAGSEDFASFQQKFDKAFGQIGSLKQAIDKLRTETPAGEKVEVSEADFKELVDAYPEIGKLTAQGLNKAMAKVRGTGGADPEAIDKMVTERVAAARTEIATEVTGRVTDAVLNGIVPRWRDQVKTPAFDAWFKAQPLDVQALGASDDLGDAAVMLRLYRRHTERPAPTPAPSAGPAAPAQAGRGNTRQRQIAAAVSTRGDGAASTSAPAQDDDFDSGFKTGRA